jgi:hypothetical protein
MSTILNQELKRLAPKIILIHKWIARASIVIFLLVAALILILAIGLIHHVVTSLPAGESMGIFDYVESFVISTAALAFIVAAWISRSITLWLSNLLIRIMNERLNCHHVTKSTD